MQKNKIQGIILAAGNSTRFQTGTNKLVEKICGQELILYPTKLLASLNIPIIMVVGNQKEEIAHLVKKSVSADIKFVTQDEQRGTGHAVSCAQPALDAEDVLIMNGDMPLVSPAMLTALYGKHQEVNADVSFVIAHHTSPETTGYGKVVKEGNKVRIVEAKDYQKTEPEDHCCINAGIYIVKRSVLENFIPQLTTDNNAQEFYLTDIVHKAQDEKKVVITLTVPFDQVRGVNTLREAWAAEQIKKSELITSFMEQGVRFTGAPFIHLDVDISIGKGTTIGQGCQILRGSIIGQNCTIEPFSILDNAVLADNITVRAHSIIQDSQIASQASVGPFAHVRQYSTLAENSIIGNFVEVKESAVGINSKAKHLAYLGNATLEANVNIGAGTITCNHNGTAKYPTIIKEGAFIGSNNTLVAPVTIGQGAYTAAGSVITESVEPYALAIGRARQINKEGYAHRLRAQAPATGAQEGQESAGFIPAKKSHNDSSVSEGS